MIKLDGWNRIEKSIKRRFEFDLKRILAIGLLNRISLIDSAKLEGTE